MLNYMFARLRNTRIVREQSGFTLIEAVIGIALLSAVVVAVLMGVSTSFKINALADSQSTAMSIAQRQVEDLQHQQNYIVAPSGGDTTYNKVANIPANFSIWSYNRAGVLVAVDENNVEGVIGVPWSSAIDGSAGSAISDDGGLQRIKLVIKQGNKEIFTVESYKVQ
jgi:type II secretory pathway pseudopilin PulG